VPRDHLSDQEEAQGIARFLRTGNRQSCPPWYFTLAQARLMAIPVYELDELMREARPDHTPASKEEWYRRGLVAVRAESMAGHYAATTKL
jgi:hypothetical protein